MKSSTAIRMRSAGGALFYVGAQLVAAQGLSFLLPQYLPIGNGCCSVLIGDFNKDGKTDIAVAHSVVGITVLLGDGKGGFTRVETAQGLPMGSTITSLLATADFNSDGVTDILAIANTGQPGIDESIVLLGRGDGSFGTPMVLTDRAQAVGDFNGDGRADLLVYNVSGFSVRFGNGDGTFQPAGPGTPLPNGGFTWVVVGDFNGDGKADVAQTTRRAADSNYVYIWLGNGDGTFRTLEQLPLSSTVLQNPNQFLGGSRMAVGDLNGDGKLDLTVSIGNEICCPLEDGGVVVFLGNGDGTFQPGVEYTTHSDQANSLIMADFNQDGRMDMARGFTLLLGNGDGSLQGPVAFGQFYNGNPRVLPSTTFDASLVAVGDFNGDGKPDLVGVASDGTQLSVLINNTPGTDSSANAVSSADYGIAVAPGSIATVFGNDLAATIGVAMGLPLPTVLANAKVRILDQNGVERLGGIIYASPSQINFLIPPETATGYAIFNVDNGKLLIEGARSTAINSIAAGFFTADGTGHGAPAATAIRATADGTQTSLPVVQCSSSCVTVPIDLSLPGTVYLSLYGTGFGNAQAASCVAANSVPLSLTYIGPQRVFPGLDQLNLQLPRTLPIGSVEVNCVFINAAGARSGSAAFTINIK